MTAKGLRQSRVLFPSPQGTAKAIAVLGATGHVGFGKLCQIAEKLARADLDIPLWAIDPSPKAKDLAARVETRLSKTLDPEVVRHAGQTLSVIQGTPKDLPPDADIGWVLEAIPENLALKRSAYAELFATLNNPPIISSTTSAYTSRTLFEGLAYPEHGSVLHPFFPHHKNPLWELASKGAVTADTKLCALRELMMAFNFDLVEVADVPAFAADRVFCGLMLEAVRTADDLGASPQLIDRVYQQNLGCTPFLVHNMIPGANGLSIHCMQLCQQEHDSTLFAIPPSWKPFSLEPNKKWPDQAQAGDDAIESEQIEARMIGMLASICSYLLHHKIVSSENLDKLCTRALAFRIGPCALFTQLGITKVQSTARKFLKDCNITLAETVAPLSSLDELQGRT